MAETKEPLPFTRVERAIATLFAPRMGLWMWVTVILLAAVWWLARHMLPVILYKGVLLTLAAFLGDKIARALERRNARPHELLARATELADQVYADRESRFTERQEALHRMRHLEDRADRVYMRRAIVVGCAMIAAALGS